MAALLALGGAAAATILPDPQYEASTSIFVRTAATGSISDRSAAADYTRQQIATYSDLALTPLVLQPTIDRLGLDLSPEELSPRISADVPEDTSLIVVSVRAESPQGAADLANAVSDSLRSEVAALEGATSVELTVVTPAVPANVPSSPDLVQNAILGTLAAVLVGVCAAVVRDLLDSKLRSPQDLKLLTDAPVLASIPTFRTRGSFASGLVHDPQGNHAEAYRELRTNLRFLEMRGRSRSVLVTSSVKGEGKSTTAINLAAALARSRRRVLLVDADLRDPSVHRCLGVEGGAGLSTVLIGDALLEDVVQPLDLENLTVLASGPVPPNPSELLDSAEMEAFLQEATATYDIVILDSPPVLAVADALVLSRMVSAVAFVAGCRTVQRNQASRALRKLQHVRARILGVVLNRVPRSDRDAYADVYGVAPDGDPQDPEAGRRSTAAGPAPRPADDRAVLEGPSVRPQAPDRDLHGMQRER
ncbi:polysaccharide biosynthesis tyrosine autokinase [Brachybacterium phenoliresistens]|uniref:polysaccharide biosynthesis tyrosine autokinase n=1 Tax=Brachybacterium phenoliresistens TaxID=396014 RepID=UPI0031D9AF53